MLLQRSILIHIRCYQMSSFDGSLTQNSGFLLQLMRLADLIGYGHNIETSPCNRYSTHKFRLKIEFFIVLIILIGVCGE